QPTRKFPGSDERTQGTLRRRMPGRDTARRRGQHLQCYGFTEVIQRKSPKPCKLRTFRFMSGREDSNLRPPEPHSGALAKLRHAPVSSNCLAISAFTSSGVSLSTPERSIHFTCFPHFL